MQYYRVEFVIKPDGSIIEKVMASGPNCTAVTEKLEKALGEVRSQELLPEYNQSLEAEDKILWNEQDN